MSLHDNYKARHSICRCPFILEVAHALVDHVALLPVDQVASLLALRVEHRPALGLGELVTVLLVSDILKNLKISRLCFR